MRRILAFAICAFAATEDQAIRQVLERQQAAWNRGDIRAFMEGYENSPDTTFVGAAVTRGYRPVLDDYIKRAPDVAICLTL